MFNKVMIGIEDRDGGRDAVRLARRLVAPGGELILGYVHSGYPPYAKGAAGDYEEAERERAREFLNRISRETGIEHTAATGSPTVGRGLHRLVEREDADLLVIGSTRHGLVGRVLIGDDTRDALGGSRCAVAVAPVGYGAESCELHRIGVGWNESEESDQALAVAREVAREHDAELAACEVVSLPTYSYYGAAFAYVELVPDLLSAAQTRIESLGGVAATAVAGDPGEELAQFSGSVDLLIVGSRGYGAFGRMLHGSTSQRLARTARCPLLVLTRGARAASVPAHESADTTVLVG